MSGPESSSFPELDPKLEQDIIDNVLPQALDTMLDRLDMAEDFERKLPETTVSVMSEITRGSMVFTYQFLAAHNLQYQCCDYRIDCGETEEQYLDGLNQKERSNLISLLMNVDIENINMDVEYYLEVLQGLRAAEDTHVLTWQSNTEYMFNPVSRSMTAKTGQSVLLDGMLVNESSLGKNYLDDDETSDDEFAAIVGQATNAQASTICQDDIVKIRTSLTRLGLLV